ncbi:MAG: hypothetical protein Barrevirus7_21 [Barrevirus sp.]|uniref:Uncharacterized protein n=1 Tax=Barrevirus sp. TaxID=2487763 RepID=A0A3G4ZRR4_9VIRU|nr:MAG: hypothetical protein Barrevirus7_21 [Barrevirus sp.]
MSQPNQTSVQSKITLDYIVGLVQRIRTNSYFKTLWYGRTYPYITGSFVYKHLVRGEDVKDIDVICPDTNELSQTLQRMESLAFCPIADWLEEESYLDYEDIKFRGSDLHVDILQIDEFVRTINRTGLSPVNSLVLTKDGIRHLTEVPEICSKLNMKSEEPEKEREWAIQNLKAGRYCKWGSMRDKDVAYFKGWTVIDFQECANHGIYDKK